MDSLCLFPYLYKCCLSWELKNFCVWVCVCECECVCVYLARLGFEFRASHLICKWYTTGAMPPGLFALVLLLLFCFVFLDRIVCFCLSWLGLCASYLCLLHSWYYRCSLTTLSLRINILKHLEWFTSF
jgi:hypothetical protein